MTLTGPKLYELHEALLDALTRKQLARVVRFAFENEKLDSIASPNSNNKDACFELIEWAESTNNLPALIRGAHRENSANALLNKFHAEWLQQNPLPSSTMSKETIRNIAEELERAQTPPIIDRVDCVDLFLNLFDPKHAHRFLRLTGNAKMGKTHLLTKVFPQIARYRNVRPIVVDLRDHSSIDILNNLCGQIDPSGFTTFDAAYSDWLNRPRLEVEDLSELLAQRDEKAKAQLLHFTRAFVGDLKNLVQTPTLLIFDQVEGAGQDVQRWLCNQLLAQLQHNPQIHVVVGGRTLPELSVAYHAICCEFTLNQVEEVEAYVEYCRQIQLNDVSDDEIKLLAHAFAYAPGAFAECMITRFVVGGHVHV